MTQVIQLVAAEEEGGGGGNFLVPNATFLFELVAFGIILWVLWKFVIPVVTGAAAEREEKLRAQREEAAQAKSSAESTESELNALMADARADASRIREEARQQGARIIAEHREQAKVDADRVNAAAHEQIEGERSQALAQLMEEVDSISTQLASRIIGESVEDSKGRKDSVSRS
jgi:F-type H+-transporting ATPase subunit b